jgi:hypothetical protein
MRNKHFFIVSMGILFATAIYAKETGTPSKNKSVEPLVKSIKVEKSLLKPPKEVTHNSAQDKPEKPKLDEIELNGMVEVTSLKKGAPQTIAIWTTLDIPQDEMGKKLTPYLYRMVKVRGTLVKVNGKWQFKVSKFLPLVEGVEEGGRK